MADQDAIAKEETKMSLFGKNPNEKAYVGGKKHWADVIKNSGSGELLIWKQPEEDFNTNSTLIVNPGEEAIFIKDGNVEQVFENGKYKLSTENYPFISRLRNVFTGGISTFNCFVYFVRKADSEEIKWGTESPITVWDNVLGGETEARARGAFKVRIENPAKFLEKLIGANVPYQTQAELTKYFSNEFQGKIKSEISKYLNSLNQKLVGIDAYIDEISEKIEPKIDEILKEYGLKCVKFSISGLDIDASAYKQYTQASVEALSRNRIAQGDKAVMQTLGDDWGRQQSANILGDMARNPGGVGAVGAGIGAGIAAGGAFGNMANEMLSSPSDSKDAAKDDDPVETLTKLKKMLDAGLIEQAEYDSKKSEILSRM